ncbi:hypothetical protein ACLEEJ_08975 [Lonsdalea quercina]|uniref:hypothetical protein n=1 Tax=Lonsdalea quercina TaxID=71657 RepID=UPI0039749818
MAKSRYASSDMLGKGRAASINALAADIAALRQDQTSDRFATCFIDGRMPGAALSNRF